MKGHWDIPCEIQTVPLTAGNLRGTWCLCTSGFLDWRVSRWFVGRLLLHGVLVLSRGRASVG